MLLFKGKTLAENKANQTNKIQKWYFSYLTHWYGRNLDLYQKTLLIRSDVSSQSHLNMTVANRNKVPRQSRKMYLLVLPGNVTKSQLVLFPLSKPNVSIEDVSEPEGVSTA